MALLLLGCANAWAQPPPSSSSLSLSKRSHTCSKTTSSTTQLPVSYSLSSAGAAAATTAAAWNLHVPTLNGGQPSSSSSSSSYTTTSNLQRKRLLGRYSQQTVKTTTTTTTTTNTRFRVYCDLDGVLVDFESGIRKLFPDEFAQVKEQNGNFNVDDLHRGTMWRRVADAPSFFEHLPWTHQGRHLWNAIAPLKPDILTGVPVAHAASSCVEKYKWCQRELGVPVTHHDKVLENSIGAYYSTSWTTRARKFLMPQQQQQSENDEDRHFCEDDVDNNDNKEYATRVITCWSRDKHLESGKNAVLIDDRLELRDDWEAAGGIFIHHNGNVHETIQKLRHAGILQQEEQEEANHHHHKNHHRGIMLP